MIRCVTFKSFFFLHFLFYSLQRTEAKRSTKIDGLRLYSKPSLENNFRTRAPVVGRVESLHNFQMLGFICINVHFYSSLKLMVFVLFLVIFVHRAQFGGRGRENLINSRKQQTLIIFFSICCWWLLPALGFVTSRLAFCFRSVLFKSPPTSISMILNKQ